MRKSASREEHFATDSCFTSCGGVSGNEFFHAEFPTFIKDQGFHIDALEQLTIVIALKLWGYRFRGKRLVVHCDKLASCLVLNKGSTKCTFMQACLRHICYLEAMGEFEIQRQSTFGESATVFLIYSVDGIKMINKAKGSLRSV